MRTVLAEPWPWYVAGPLFGLLVPLLMLAGGKALGISGSYRPLCAMALPRNRPSFFRYDWREVDGWNLVFVFGVVVGGVLAATVLRSPDPVIDVSAATHDDLRALGLTDFRGFVPSEIISWSNLATPRGFGMMVGGGFLVGFGARYAGGCTSGHAITGLADLQPASLMAVLGFFLGGVLSVHIIFPWFV